jgi:hypothetical protein
MTSKKASTASIPGIWQRTLPTLGEVPASLMVVMMFFVAGLSAFAGGNAPVASSMSITVLEDLPVTIPLQATDNEGDPLTYSIVSRPDAKSGVLSGTGANLTFIPVNNFNGDATFTFKVNDGTSDSEVATVYIEVLSVNDAPILNGFVVSGKEDERMSLSESLFSAQYSDLEGDPFDSLTVTTLPKTGVLKWDGTPVFAGQIIPANLLDQLIYDPAKDDNGVRSFTVRGSDGLSLSTLTTVTMVIAAVNDVPVLANITKSSGLLEDAVVPFAAVDFTSKYDDIEKTPLSSIRIKTVPPLGTLKLGGIGLKAGDVVLAADLNSLKFEPAAHQNGDVVFQVSASDGVNASADALVSLFITPVNDAPSGVISLSTVTVAEDSGAYNNPAFITGATSGPSNESAQSMAYSMVTSDLTLFSVPPSISDDGRLTFIPGDNKNGTATVTVTLKDSGGVLDGGVDSRALGSFSIVITAVDDRPIAVAQSVTLTEDLAQGITLVGSDVEKAPLTYTVVQPPTKGVLSGSGSARTYTPNPNEYGSDRFTYKVTASGQDSETVTVALSIISVNDAPSFEIPKSTTVTGDNTTPVVVSDYVVNATEDTFMSVPDFATKISSGPSNEFLQTVKLVLNVTLNPELFAIAPAISADGTLTFTPASDANGTAKVEVFAQDDGGTADGGVDRSPVQTFLVTVAAVNDPPVAGSQVVTATEDTEQVITLQGFDAEASLLTYTIVKAPLKGTLSAPIGDQVTYRPGANETGVDKFTFRVSDGVSESSEATVRIVVTPVNDAPEVRDVSAVTAERVPVELELVGTDVDADRLFYSIVSAPSHGQLTGSGANLVYLSEWGFSGTDRFTFKANDGSTHSSVGTVTIQVTPINQAPVAGAFSAVTDEDMPLSLTLNGVDLEGSDLTYTVVRPPSKGVLSGDGAIRQYAPNLDFNGTDSFTFKVSDGELDSGLATVTIRVNPINDAPVAGAFSVGTDEDTGLSLTLKGVDSEGSALTYTVIRQPVHGTLIGEGNRREYIPKLDFNGTDSFTYKVSDGELESGQVTVSIRVNSINDAPIAGAFSAVTDEDMALSLTLMGVDLEESALTYKVVRPPAHGTLMGDGRRREYIPNLDFNGTDSFTYRVNDGELDSGQVTVSIRVNPVQDAPIALAQSVKVIQGSSVPVTLVGFDADQDSLDYKVVSQTKQGTLSGSGANWIYQANDDAVGFDTFTYRVNDGFADSGLVSVRINIGEKSTLGVKSFNGSSITLEVRAPNGAVVQVENASSIGAWVPTAIKVTGHGPDFAVPVTVPIDRTVPARFWRLKVLSTP